MASPLPPLSGQSPPTFAMIGLRRDTLKEIALQLNIDNDSTVSSELECVKKDSQRIASFIVDRMK